ncbi:MAG: Gfo/Idh/MocA family protein [Armatimonadota bacterium]
MDTITAGVVGLGSMGVGWHCEQLARIDGFALICGADPSAERRALVAEQFGIETHAHYEEMLARPDLDLVVVATPSAMHRDHVLAALQAGKHCVCEKPLCMDLAQCDQIIAAAERTGLMVSAYQNRRWDADHLAALDTVRSGLLGELFFTKQISMSYSPIMRTYGVKEFRPHWRAEKRYGGGLLYDFGPHRIDQLLGLLDYPPVRDVYCDLQSRVWSDEVDDCCLLVIRFENGVTSQVETTTVARLGLGGTLLVGRDGAYRDGTIKVGEGEGEREFPARSFERDWDAFYRSVHAHLTAGEPLAVPLWQTRRMMAIIDAALRSAATSQVVGTCER